MDASTPPDAPPTPKSTIKALAAGTSHACALLADGTVHCWGSNLYKQLGVEDVPDRCDVFGESVPCRAAHAEVPTLRDVIELSAAGGTTCALKTDGSVWCWGLTDSGTTQCDGLACNAMPTKVALPPATVISVGLGFACAGTADGMYCWGRNDLGQLARGTSGEPAPPAKSLLPGTVAKLATRSHACAIQTDGALYCWGPSAQHQAGEPDEVRCRAGSERCSTTPKLMPIPEDLKPLTDVAVLEEATCVLGSTLACGGSRRKGGTGHPWDGGVNPSPDQTPITRVENIPQLTTIKAGNRHVCGVSAEGIIVCWGTSACGQIGGPPKPDARACDVEPVTPPRPVPGAAGELLATGSDFTLTATETVLSGWGLNVSNQLGQASTTTRCTLAETKPGGACTFEVTSTAF